MNRMTLRFTIELQCLPFKTPTIPSFHRKLDDQRCIETPQPDRNIHKTAILHFVRFVVALSNHLIGFIVVPTRLLSDQGSDSISCTDTLEARVCRGYS